MPLTLPLEFLAVFGVGACLFLLAAASRTWIAVTLLLVTLVFSDLLISLISPRLSSGDEILILQGFSFLALATLTAPLLLQMVHRKRNDFLDLLILFAILLLTLYWIIGCVLNGLRDATMYYRLFMMPLLLIVLGRKAGNVMSLGQLRRIVVGIAAVVSALVAVEFLAPRAYYTTTGAETFFSIKDGYFSLEDLVKSRQRRLFNLKLIEDFQVFKPAGPTLNYPSTAYVVLAGFTTALAFSASMAALWCLVGLAIVTAKAAVVGVIAITATWFIAARLQRFVRPRTVIAVGVLYALAATWLLYQDLSIHAYSLLSTLLQLPANPLGHGLGFGGSLTAERVLSWRLDMLIGDSGLAITLNMLGFPGILLYFLYGFLFARAFTIARAYRDLPLLCFASLLAVAVFNSVVQELAIGPYAVGLAGFLCAFRIAALQTQAGVDLLQWSFHARATRARSEPGDDGDFLERPAWSR